MWVSDHLLKATDLALCPKVIVLFKDTNKVILFFFFLSGLRVPMACSYWGGVSPDHKHGTKEHYAMSLSSYGSILGPYSSCQIIISHVTRRPHPPPPPPAALQSRLNYLILCFLSFKRTDPLPSIPTRLCSPLRLPPLRIHSVPGLLTP